MLVQMNGTFKLDGSGNVELKEEDGLDYAAVTVQLPGGERVPFLFTVKELVAKGPANQFGGDFTVPSYRGSTFLDPKVSKQVLKASDALLHAGCMRMRAKLATLLAGQAAALKGSSCSSTQSDICHVAPFAGRPCQADAALKDCMSHQVGTEILDGQGRGGSTGYDAALALPARSDSEELAKENNKSIASLKGEAVFSIAKVGCQHAVAGLA